MTRSSHFASFTAGLLLAAAPSVLCTGGAQAQVIALNNPSFELPQITPVPGSQDPADFVLPFIDGWNETGPITNQQGFAGRLDTGVFINTPVQIDPETILPPIPNADGNQLAFMQVNPLAGVGGEELVSISQETGALFEAERDYRFTVAIGGGVLFPPTGTAQDPATLVLSIGFFAPSDGGFVDLFNRVVNANELAPQGLLTDFSVTADVTAVNSPTNEGSALGNEVAVLITQLGGTGGGFNLDIARLVARVPADLDFDGDVDDADFGAAFAAFTGPGNGPSSNPAADLDGDNDVDDADFGLAFAAFTGPGAPASVPEPASMALLALGGIALVRRRR